MEFLLYLAGPIRGCSYQTCTDWRKYVAQKLPSHIKTLSPMRGKEHLASEKQIFDGTAGYENHPLTSRKGIVSRDRFDIMRADAILMNLLDAKVITIGTVIEIGWADAFRKPIILAMQDDNVHAHPLIREIVSFIVPTLDEAINVAIGVLSPDDCFPLNF